ncbi:MAG: hypothetical protein Q9164_001144 [Protoblastenia rupestris]
MLPRSLRSFILVIAISLPNMTACCDNNLLPRHYDFQLFSAAFRSDDVQSLQFEGIDKRRLCTTINAEERISQKVSMHYATFKNYEDDRRMGQGPTSQSSSLPLNQTWTGEKTRLNKDQSSCTHRPDTTSEKVGSLLRPRSPKALLSPFDFKQPTETGHAEIPQQYADYSATPFPHSLDFGFRAIGSQSESSTLVPRRQLSYGEPSGVGEAKTSTNSSGPREIQQKRQEPDTNSKCTAWVNDTAKVTADRPYHSGPSRQKPRLWLDLVEADEKTEEAVHQTYHLLFF